MARRMELQASDLAKSIAIAIAIHSIPSLHSQPLHLTHILTCCSCLLIAHCSLLTHAAYLFVVRTHVAKPCQTAEASASARLKLLNHSLTVHGHPIPNLFPLTPTQPLDRPHPSSCQSSSVNVIL